jgi:hypothetical protein
MRGDQTAQPLQRLVSGWPVQGSKPRAARHFLFPYKSRPIQGPTQPPLRWIPGLFPRVERPERVAEHPTHLAPKLKMSGAMALLPLCTCAGVLRGDVYLIMREKILYQNETADNLNDLNCGK